MRGLLAARLGRPPGSSAAIWPPVEQFVAVVAPVVVDSRIGSRSPTGRATVALLPSWWRSLHGLVFASIVESSQTRATRASSAHQRWERSLFERASRRVDLESPNLIKGPAGPGDTVTGVVVSRANTDLTYSMRSSVIQAVSAHAKHLVALAACAHARMARRPGRLHHMRGGGRPCVVPARSLPVRSPVRNPSPPRPSTGPVRASVSPRTGRTHPSGSSRWPRRYTCRPTIRGVHNAHRTARARLDAASGRCRRGRAGTEGAPEARFGAVFPSEVAGHR
jgi:hypothetical protein